jgi:hypothetical protein
MKILEKNGYNVFKQLLRGTFTSTDCGKALEFTVLTRDCSVVPVARCLVPLGGNRFGLLCDQELMGKVHTIAKRASGNKPHLDTYKVEGLAPYNYKGQQWNELHCA